MAKHIQIIEADALNRKFLIDLLQASGYEATAASNAADSAVTGAGSPPDLIVAELGFDGQAAAGCLRDVRNKFADRRIPVIAVTARAMAGDRQALLDCGCDVYIAKPISATELLNAVESLLGNEQRATAAR